MGHFYVSGYTINQCCTHTTFKIICTEYKKTGVVVCTFMKDSVLNLKKIYNIVIV